MGTSWAGTGCSGTGPVLGERIPGMPGLGAGCPAGVLVGRTGTPGMATAGSPMIVRPAGAAVPWALIGAGALGGGGDGTDAGGDGTGAGRAADATGGGVVSGL